MGRPLLLFAVPAASFTFPGARERTHHAIIHPPVVNSRAGFLRSRKVAEYDECSPLQSKTLGAHYCTQIPDELHAEIQSVAETLWGGSNALSQVLLCKDGLNNIGHMTNQGEVPLPSSIPVSERFAYYLQQANLGDARAQHSVGLLLWNGFAEHSEGIVVDAKKSAKWHAAAAVQGNIDALAVLGGCLRTGTGVGKCKNIGLGLRCIEFAASIENPSGINKMAALLESNDDWFGAVRLYRNSHEIEQINALLLFNYGYCLVNGYGTERDVEKGVELWNEATNRSPDEGSEEAAWFLYQQYENTDPTEAVHWLDISASLGYQEAIQAKQ